MMRAMLNSPSAARRATFMGLAFLIGAGCTSSASDRTGSAGATGGAGSGSSAAGAGAAGSGAAGSSVAGSGAAGSSVAGSVGAAAGTVGAAGGGSGSAGPGSAGTAGPPKDGSADGGSGDASSPGVVDLTPMPSAGCSMAHDPTKGVTGSYYAKVNITINGKATEYILTIPPTYKNDSTKPYPLAVAFAPRTRTEFDCMNGDCQGIASEGRATAVVVFMKQIGLGWELKDERDNNLELFKQVLAQVEATYCVDTHRIYTVGLSSGADFSMYVGCWMGDQLRSVASVSGCMPNTVAPVAGSSPEPAPASGMENPANICLKTLDLKDCKGHPSVLMIHGNKDGVVTAANPMGRWIPFADAKLTRDAWVGRNGCGTTTTTMVNQAPAGQFDGPITCNTYQGCGDSPVQWCEHGVPGFDGNSTHGWPGSAGKVVWNFWKSLK
jgi:predicted esterase